MLDEFTKCVQRVNFILKLIGLEPNVENNQKSFCERLRSHRLFVFHVLCFNMQVFGELCWLYDALINGKSFLEITFLFPCLTVCVLSNCKGFCALIYAHCINDLLERLDTLYLEVSNDERDTVVTSKLFNKHVSELKSISMKMTYLIIFCILMFTLGPLFIMLPQYYKTGGFEFALPFFTNYPFNAYAMPCFPYVYAHQVWAAFEVMFFIYGPDYFFFTSCTFIHIQFLLLQYDMERVVEDVEALDNITIRLNIKKLATRHVKLMRCVELLEIIYSKSMLLNAATSSLMICVTGFNVMVNDDVMTVASFTSFLSFSSLQIFLYCYYGDNIMRSSMEVSDAIYNSLWYKIDPRLRRSFLIILIRAQRPCELTAYGFLNINLRAFTSVLSTSWSYFALLKTMYSD